MLALVEIGIVAWVITSYRRGRKAQPAPTPETPKPWFPPAGAVSTYTIPLPEPTPAPVVIITEPTAPVAVQTIRVHDLNRERYTNNNLKPKKA